LVNHIVRTLCKYLQIPLPLIKQPKPSFTEASAEIIDFNNYIKKQACPNCHETKTFAVTNYERGKGGFEAKVICTACETEGTVNTTGFQYTVKRVLRSSKK